MTMFLWELQDLSAGVQVQLLFLIGVHIMTPLKRALIAVNMLWWSFQVDCKQAWKWYQAYMSYILYLIQNLMWKITVMFNYT